MDTSFFWALATIPFLVKRPHVLFFDDALLGLLLASLGLSYVVAALVLPRIFQAYEPIATTRAAGLLAGLLFFSASFVHETWALFLLLSLGRAALGAYWPKLMALVGSGAQGGLAARIARFNCWWGTGKALAFLLCGSLLSLAGDPGLVLRIAAFVMGSSVVLIGGVAVRSSAACLMAEHERLSVEILPAVPERGPQIREPGFAAALAALLLGATIAALWESQFPKGLGQQRFAAQLGASYDFGINVLLFCLYGGQALLFFIYRFCLHWPQARWTSPAALAVLVLMQAVARFSTSLLLSGAALFVTGMTLGVFFSRSLWNAQSGRGDRGRRSGVHEGVLSLGAVLGPPLGGVLAVWSARLEAPFDLALGLAVAAAITAVLSVFVFRSLPAGQAGTGRLSR